MCVCVWRALFQKLINAGTKIGFAMPEIMVSKIAFIHMHICTNIYRYVKVSLLKYNLQMWHWFCKLFFWNDAYPVLEENIFIYTHIWRSSRFGKKKHLFNWELRSISNNSFTTLHYGLVHYLCVRDTYPISIWLWYTSWCLGRKAPTKRKWTIQSVNVRGLEWRSIDENT